MAKRSNPFSEDFVQQSKVHVGIKQFNNNEDRLQKVYEKTLQLLFRGAKKPPVKNTSEEPTDLNDVKKDGFKQLFLGKDGHLMQCGVITKQTTLKCPCGALSDDRCSYCEKSLCGDCQHTCERCHLYYCSHCSLIGMLLGFFVTLRTRDVDRLCIVVEAIFTRLREHPRCTTKYRQPHQHSERVIILNAQTSITLMSIVSIGK